MKNTQEAIKMLEEGVMNFRNSDKFKEYLKFMTKFHKYSYNNCIMIQIQKPDATQVAGYRAWQALGRQVMKGEKAIKILAPTIKKNEDDEPIVHGFMIASVFDVSQTIGDELPSIANELKGDIEADLLDKLIGISPVPVEFDEISDAWGYYDSFNNIIRVNTQAEPKQRLKTLIHEIAHAELHSKGGEEVDCDRETQEVQAESVSFIVCDYLGIDTSEYSFEYIGSWIDTTDAKELKNSLKIIQKTSDKLISKLEKEVEQ
jgi:antirestriction protein ArdC